MCYIHPPKVLSSRSLPAIPSSDETFEAQSHKLVTSPRSPSYQVTEAALQSYPLFCTQKHLAWKAGGGGEMTRASQC